MSVLTDQAEAVAYARPLLDLQRILHPVDVRTFRRDYWEKKPLLVRREDHSYYGDLLSLDDMDLILGLSGPMLDSVRIVQDGHEVDMESLLSAGKVNAVERVMAHYRSGATLVVNSLDSRWEPLNRVSRALGAALNARIQMNIYVTPAGNRGFKPHYDMHDVFVAQVQGSKRWGLASQPYELPLNGQPYDRTLPEPEPEQEFDLTPGDLIYLPRGTVHWGRSNDTTSVHITMGLHPVLWSDLIDNSLKQLYTRDARFRAGLPMGFANEPELREEVTRTAATLMDTVRQELNPDMLADAATTRAASIHWPTLRYHLLDLERLDGVEVDTQVRVRDEQRWKLDESAETVSLSFHDKTVELPARVSEEIRYIVANRGTAFNGKDLPGELDAPSRLVLIKTLLEQGFLTLAEH